MTFDADVIEAVTGHMNSDHRDDNLLIVRAFGHPSATEATMTTLDAQGGTWSVTDDGGAHSLTVPWPGGEVSERPQIRRQVVELYRAACEKLGVPAREEHAPETAHAHHPEHAAEAGEPGFAQRMRKSTWNDHEDSEGASFMADLLRGRGTRDDYVQLVAQHWFMYEALEDAAEQLSADPALAAMHPHALLRLSALEHDLTHLIGPNWRDEIHAVPATEAYAQRIREVAVDRWIAGIIAHHYTRYLGDLAGGQLIAKRMAAQFQLDEAGVAFYDFTDLGEIGPFREQYRAALDAFGAALDADEQERMLDEVRAAYGHNTAVFVDLEHARTAG